MRIDGQPWEQFPSGSTMQPSEQQAGDVASNNALRANASRLSGVSENPSFSRASVALIRYGLRCVVFIMVYRASIARGTHRCRWVHRGIQAMASMKCRFPFPWAGINTDWIPFREPGQPRQIEHGVPLRSLAHNSSNAWWSVSGVTRKVDQPSERAMSNSAVVSTLAIRIERQPCKEGFRH